jgi:hypothetical protein
VPLFFKEKVMATKNPVRAFRSRNRHRLNRIRAVLAKMEAEANVCKVPFDTDVGTHLLTVFHHCFCKRFNPSDFEAANDVEVRS